MIYESVIQRINNTSLVVTLTHKEIEKSPRQSNIQMENTR